MNSWEKSDTCFGDIECYNCDNRTPGTAHCDMVKHGGGHRIGPNDLDLMTRLRNAGTDHRKFMRYLDVYVDITAPLYFWKEFKTYRRGRKFMDDDEDILEPFIETNSCSTMHKIHEKEFTLEDFSMEHVVPINVTFCDYDLPITNIDVFKSIINILNGARDKYIETKDKAYWWTMIQLLPSSYNQKRTVKLNYEVLARMYHARKNHKLDEWREFCKWIEGLPYSELITGKISNDEVSDGEVKE